VYVVKSIIDDQFQQDLELRALDAMNSPEVRTARQYGESLLRKSVPYPVYPESLELFAASTEELTFFAVLQGLNQDRASPNAHFAGRLPVMRGGRLVPGSRGIDDNPDTVYRVFPIHGAEDYLLTGRMHAQRPVVSDFSILSDALITIDNLAEARLVTDDKGAFEILMSAEPAPDHPNHLHSDLLADRQFVVIRETLGDWKRQRPCQLQIRRLSSNAIEAISTEALIKSAAFHVKWWFELTVKLHSMAFANPPNFLPQPKIRSDNGMLVTQAYSIGHFNIADDQALVLTLNEGDAGYVTVPVTNLWGITTDHVRRTMSLNTSQAAHNADGTITFVLSLKDPGVANWVDPGGLRQGLLFLRWAAFAPEAKAGGVPSVGVRLVSLRDLERTLPTPLVRVDPETRKALAIEREADYASRFERWWLSPSSA
jgi:hypothetical protein